MRRRWFLAGATILLALMAFAAGLLLSRRTAPPLADSPLPAPAAVERLLAAPLLDPAGAELTLARWQGKPLVVNFWATWCPPCLTEMPVFSRLQEKHRQVQFVGIAIDTRENVADFVGKNAYAYPLVLGSENAAALMPELGNNRNGLPFTIGIDARGQVRRIRLGGLSEREAEDLVFAIQ